MGDINVKIADEAVNVTIGADPAINVQLGDEAINAEFTDGEVVSVQAVDEAINVQSVEESLTVQLGDEDSINVVIAGADISQGRPFTKTFTGDGTTVKFTFDFAFRSESLLVFLEGIFQGKSLDYTEAVDGKSITFTTTPKANRKIEVFGAYA